MAARDAAVVPAARPGARIDQAADFERVLRVAPCARSTQFALHHLSADPLTRAERSKLSTGQAPTRLASVDDLPVVGVPAAAPAGLWWGAVVPKRHARRSVTRNLVKRQIRSAMAVHASALADGIWVVRLRAPLDPQRFRSAASATLCQHLGLELQRLLVRAQGLARAA
jgi:ribonuclease P protein component